MIDKYWNRAIVSSVNRYFTELKGTHRLYLEGETPAYDLKTWAELRVNGPVLTERMKNQFSVNLSVDLMCSMAIPATNIYALQDIVGHFQNTINNIQIYQLDVATHGTVDLTLPFFCARQVGPVATVQWGKVNNRIELMCASIESAYEGEFTWPLSI